MTARKPRTAPAPLPPEITDHPATREFAAQQVEVALLVVREALGEYGGMPGTKDLLEILNLRPFKGAGKPSRSKP